MALQGLEWSTGPEGLRCIPFHGARPVTNMPSANRVSVHALMVAVTMAGASAQAMALSMEAMNKARSDASAASVDIQVPTAQAPLSCLTGPKGEVEDVDGTGFICEAWRWCQSSLSLPRTASARRKPVAVAGVGQRLNAWSVGQP